MAASTSTASSTSFPVSYGRSGYNGKPDDDDDSFRNQGRSGYNGKPDDDDDSLRNFGRSGYNKGGDDDEE